MKKLLLLILISKTVSYYAQFSVGRMSVNFKDQSRTGGYTISGGITMPGTGRTIGSEIYYPATTSGTNVTVAAGQFPVVVFGHGFVMTWDSYDNIYNRIASLGYIVILPRTEGGLSPNHTDFGADLKNLAAQGLALNTTNTPTILATFNSKVMQTVAIGGHSMGAGSSFLSTANNTTVTCLFNFAAATTNPSSIASASLVTVPALIISGEKDSVADSTVQNSHYNATASSKKFQVIIKDLTHCDVGNGTSGTCTFGQAACNTPSCNSTYFKRYMTYLEPFLANQLKGDCNEGKRFMDTITSVSSNRVGRKLTGTLLCTTTSLNSLTDSKLIFVYPNPTKNSINISYTQLNDAPTTFELYDMYGKLVLKTSATTINSTSIRTQEINITSLNDGVYILTIKQEHHTQSIKIVKQPEN